MAGKHRKGGGPVDEPVAAAGLVGEPYESPAPQAPAHQAAEAQAYESHAHQVQAYDVLVDEHDAPPDLGSTRSHADAAMVPAAAVSLLPAPGTPVAGQGAAAEAAPVLPGISSPTARRAVRELRRQRARRTRLLVVGAAVVGVVALVVGLFVVLRGGGSAPAVASPVATRPQTTVLLQLIDGHRQTLDGVLLAHDTRDQGTGYGALVPSALAVDVPGGGPSTFGATSVSVGDAATGSLSDALGVVVDGGWQLDQTGFAALVDAVGGVSVTVDHDVTQSSAAGSAIVVTAGPQHLSGAQAVEYATFLAAGEAEQSRLARFSTVLGAVLTALPADQTALTHDLAGLTTHSSSTLSPAKLAAFVSSLRADTVGQRMSYDMLPVRVLDTGNATSQLLLDPTPTAALVAKNFSGSLPSQSAAGPLRVLVQNGVGTPGLGAEARPRLVAAGLTYVNGGNASQFGQAKSVILILDGSDKSRQQGAVVAKALGLPASDVAITQIGQTVADVVVVLGKDFTP